MAYSVMKKLIQNESNKLSNGTITTEEYTLWKAQTQKKLDVFFACDRLTDSQYEELNGMLLTM